MAAVEHPCPGPNVTADAALRQRYPELLEQLRSELADRASVDACASVELRAETASVAVSVELPDGRATTREVSRVEDVLPTVQALLLVPEMDRREAKPTTPVPPLAREAEPRNEAPHPSEHDASPLPRREREHGFELSLVSGVRVGDGQYGYGAGVLSFIEIRRWLIGFQGRADGYRALRGSDPETALALGVLFGRRTDVGGTALDFTVGPAVAMRGASFSETSAVSGQRTDAVVLRPAAPPERDVGPTPRLLLGVRWGFSPRSVFRTFVGIDGELGPRRGADAPASLEPTSGRMPAYTIGLALGATVGTR
jgi:hypothetical protein